MDAVVAAHSGIRWLVLVALVATVVVGFMRSSREESPTDRWLTWVGVLFGIQVLLGVILYIFNQGWDQGGFIAVYHPIGMILAIAIFNMGTGRGRKTGGGAGWRTIAIMTLVSLVLVLAAIPWQR
ncbi:MAG TPA: hypothetical protein VJ938_06790 [Acidimicrobiia bacterium]|nr:hypothetical protein [Acidimicrobiia bacterium]